MTAKFVDIWSGDILSEQSEEKLYYQYLNATEKQKAGTFARSELQRKYIKTRGVLRKVLAEYLNERPQQVNIKLAEYGKPFVDQTLFFNLSHSANRFVIAVTNVSEIGVDLEQVRQRKNLQGLVKKCFSALEINYWEGLSEQQKIFAFYQFWVRKEAFVKAIGRGIAVGLDQCVINPEKQTQFLSIPELYGNNADWKIMDISLNKNDICALVVRNSLFSYTQNEI